MRDYIYTILGLIGLFMSVMAGAIIYLTVLKVWVK